MSVQFQRELNTVRKNLLSLGAVVEDLLTKAMVALINRDRELADNVARGDAEVDRREIDIEEDCLKILALHQPVAHDLRFLIAVLKMNNDLERMGDITTNIAKRARWLSKRDAVAWPDGLEELAGKVKLMVEQSLDALVTENGQLARQVCASDTEVDDLKRQMSATFRDRLAREPQNAETLLKMLDVPRHLERIADLATNIAEDVIYMVEGEIIRHKHQHD
jgi:phosphate transport system protein